jgi:glycosyltransferase involved in cell wall biosynthesis
MISVITPVYNAQNYIESCLKNVIAQNCSQVEHILVDGGSTDKTVTIIQQYSQHYPHIRWISEKDRGQSDAMNKGITMAQGEILGILNVDDFYEPNVLNRVIKIFQELPEPSLLVGNCNVLHKEDKIEFVDKPKNLNIIYLLSRKGSHPCNPSAYFYHKSLHERIGLYDINDHYAMDFDFILKAVQNANVKYVDEIWGNYRYIEGTKTFFLAQKGINKKLRSDISKKHLKNLPLYQQWQVIIEANILERKKEISKIKNRLFQR